MNVRWAASALADLRAIRSYIAQHSPNYADAMVQRIIDRTALLGDHPQIGAVLDEYKPEVLREVLVNPYRIIYCTLSEQIDIIAVIHAARTLPPGLPGSGE